MSLILLFMISLLPIQHGSIVRYTCKAIYYESYKSSPAYLHFPNLAIYTFPYENSRPWVQVVVFFHLWCSDAAESRIYFIL